MNLKLYTLIALLISTTAFSQTTYTIGSSANWSAKIPTTCANCTINISSGATLTVDQGVTCQNCVFNGPGSISITNQTLNIQYTGSTTTTYFNNVNLTVYGDNGKVVVNAPLSLTNSIFTFYNGSYFNTSYDVTLVASKVYLYDNSSMYSTGGSSTLISLSSSSSIVIGTGSQTSKSIVTVSGPTLQVYDNSTVVIANENNVYYNWSSYQGAATTSSTKTSYSTNNSTMNCGGSHAHSCASPYVYGPATLTYTGVVSGATLPVVLADFTAQLQTSTVAISWSTKLEQNVNYFEIQRSADGSSWTSIGNVAAVGNTSLGANYTFTDASPLSGINYYRLKMVDLDAAYNYSSISVVRNGVIANISFFPNPAKDFVNVSLGANSGDRMTIRLFSQSGQLLQQKDITAAEGTVVSLPLQNVASGFYFLSVTGADGTRQTSKLIVSRS